VLRCVSSLRYLCLALLSSALLLPIPAAAARDLLASRVQARRTLSTQDEPEAKDRLSWRYRAFFPYRMQFEQISVEEGLSNASVYAILQDSRGFMWFGTEDGLNKYDGHTFTVYKQEPGNPHSLSSNAVLGLHEDRSGTLWVATFGGGLNRFDRRTQTFTHYRHDPDDPDSISTDYLVRIGEDRQGILWITTEGGGLNRFDPATGAFAHYRHDPDDPASISHDIVTRVLEDSHGDLWVGTDGGGLNRLDRGTGTFTRYRHDPEDPSSLGNDVIWSILEDQDGELWIGTFGGGIARYDREQDRFVRYRHDSGDPTSLSSNDVRLLYEDSQGTLWIGTMSNGLDRFDREREQFVHIPAVPGDEKSLQSGAVWSLYEDRSGVLWVGTLGAGLQKHSRQQERFIHVPAGMEGPSVLDGGGVEGFVEDRNGNLWLATAGGGLDRFDPRSGYFVHYHHDPQNPASISQDLTGPLILDPAGVLWIGTFGGGVNGLDLARMANLDPETARFIRLQADPAGPGNFHDIIWSLHAGRSGTLWVGTQTGLDAYVPDRQRVRHYRHSPTDGRSLSNDVIRALLEDSHGRLWIGTDVGLNLLDLSSGTFTRYQNEPDNPDTLSNNIIFTIYEDQAGILWLGTWGGGLNRFDPEQERFAAYTEKDGLPSDSVFAITEDTRGDLWLSTSKGLARFDRETESFTNFDNGDGLYGLETGGLFLSQTGELLVADGSGFTIFDPDKLDTFSPPPAIVLTALSQGGERLELEQTADGLANVTLEWPRNFFEFEYSALDYVRPAKNQFAYMLEGFDTTWNEMGARHFGRYTNLPGGRYTLRIKGSNSAGVWNEQGTAVTLTVVPPIWETWWFRLLVGLAVVSVAATAYTLRLRNLSQQQRRLETEVDSRTREVDALYAIAAEASRSVNLQEILPASLDKTLVVMEADAGGVYLLGEEGTLAIAAQQGFTDALVAAINNLKVGEGFSGRVVEKGEPLVVQDLAADPRLTRHAVAEAGFRTVAVVPVEARGQISGSLYVASRREHAFVQEDLELLTSIGRQLGGAVAHARLFAEEQRRAEQFRVINEVGRRITAILDIDQLLEEIVRLIQRTFGYYHVALGMIDGDEVVYDVGAGELWDDPYFDFRPARLKVGKEGLSGWVAARGEPALVPDVSRDPRYVWMEGSQTRSELIVPIEIQGQIVGVLDAQSDRLNAFDEIDRVVMQSLAHQAATAIENARLYAQARQLAVVEERSRLARDLHDAVTQSVYSLTLLAEVGKRMIAGHDLPEIASNQSRIGDIAQQALQEMRLLVFQLRPSELKELGLAGALEQRLEVVERRAGIEARLQVEGEGTLPSALEEQLYRITQEALNNALKHARATTVTVTIHVNRDAVTITVSDDGRGFEPLSVGDRGGLGLPNMRERTRKIGGRLEVDSAPGAGTTVCISAPIPAGPQPKQQEPVSQESES